VCNTSLRARHHDRVTQIAKSLLKTRYIIFSTCTGNQNLHTGDPVERSGRLFRQVTSSTYEAALRHILDKYYFLNTVTWMARALLGNGPLNTPRPNTHKATMEDVSQWRNVIARCWATAQQ
jgi:hypothetical protein